MLPWVRIPPHPQLHEISGDVKCLTDLAIKPDRTIEACINTRANMTLPFNPLAFAVDAPPGDMGNPIYITLLALISSGSIAVLIRQLASVWRTYILKKGNGVRSYLEDNIYISDTMQKMIGSGASRVLIFSAHNCGGVPNLGKPFYTSMIYREFDHDDMDDVPNYQNIEVDNEYIKILLQLLEERSVNLEVASMPPSLLRSYLETEGIVENIIHHIGVYDSEYYYMSVGAVEEFTDIERTKIGLLANDIRTRFRESRK